MNSANTLTAFLKALKAGDCVALRKVCQKTWLETASGVDDKLRTLVEATSFTEYKLGSIRVISEVLVDIAVSLDHKNPVFIRLIKELAAYRPSREGTWGVNPVTALRLIEQPLLKRGWK